MPTSGADLIRRWNDHLCDLAYRDPGQIASAYLMPVGEVDRDAVADLVIASSALTGRPGTPPTSAGRSRSAWPARRGHRRGGADRAGRGVTARATDRCTRLLARSDVPEHVRALTSPRVLEVEDDIVPRLAARATRAARGARFRDGPINAALRCLDPEQAQVIRTPAGDGDDRTRFAVLGTW